MALCDAEIGEQEGDRLGFHRATAIGVDGKVRSTVFSQDRLADEDLGKLSNISVPTRP
jgi:hypothetical protein